MPKKSLTKNPARKAAPKKGAPRSRTAAESFATSAKATDSGPSGRSSGVLDTRDVATTKMSGTELLAERFPFNAHKASEHDREPVTGQSEEPPTPVVRASTLSESVASQKVGEGTPPEGYNPGNGPLDRVRVDSGGRALTTNQGVLSIRKSPAWAVPTFTKFRSTHP